MFKLRKSLLLLSVFVVLSAVSFGLPGTSSAMMTSEYARQLVSDNVTGQDLVTNLGARVVGTVVASVVPTPVPAAVWLLGTGLLGLLGIRRKFQK